MIYRSVIRPLLFLFKPETIHRYLMVGLRVVLSFPVFSKLLRIRLYYREEVLGRTVGSIYFPNPVGLAAGFDKGAVLSDRLRALGFGFVEVGTVTPRPQAGNPKPRIFRLPEDSAIINRMGFNSEGLERVVDRLSKRKAYRIPVAGNIGKNTATPNEEAIADYLACMRGLYALVDYFVVNVSCPNVAHLSALQSCEGIVPIAQALVAERDRLGGGKPIFLKLGPDQPDESLALVAKTTLGLGIDGFVLCNTTTSREGLRTARAEIDAIGNGGLSGKPLFERSLGHVEALRKAVGRGVPIVAVGGIFTGEDALRMLKAGATMLEIYTGFIYEGPMAARNINRYLMKHVEDIPQW